MDCTRLRLKIHLASAERHFYKLYVAFMLHWRIVSVILIILKQLTSNTALQMVLAIEKKCCDCKTINFYP